MAGPRRTVRDELVDQTPHGGVYLRRLRRAQLSLAGVTLVAFGALFGVLPFVLQVAPGLADERVLGLPASVALLLVWPFVVFVVLAALHQRRADETDEAFRDLVEDP